MARDLTQGTPWKLILRFALPIMAGNLLQQLYNTADTLIVGKFEGEAALSAVGACSSMTLLFVALAIGFSIGAGVIVSQYFGARKYDELRRYAATAIVLMLSMGLVMLVIGVLSARGILQLLGTPEALIGMSTVYFRIYAAGLVFQFGYNVAAAILRAIGDSKATLYFLLLSSVLNVILDLLFVAVFHKGVAGAAVATIISQFASCLAGFLYMNKMYELLRFKVSELKFELDAAKRVLRVGAPMALQQAVVSCGFLFLQRLVNSYGESMVASFTVASRMETIMHIPVVGIQNTMATFAGQNMGARKPERVSKGLGQAVILSILTTIVPAALVFFCGKGIVTLFGIGEEAAAYCLQHLRLASIVIFIFAAYFPANGMFQGAGEGFQATFFALLALGLRVAFAYALHTTQLFGYTAIWWSQPISWVITLSWCYIHFFRGTWKTKSLVK